MRLSISIPSENTSLTALMLKGFADEINNSKINIDAVLFTEAVECPQGKEIDYMKTGSIDAGTVSASDVTEKLPSFGIYARPFHFRNFEEIKNLYKGVQGEPLKQQVETACDVHIVGQFYFGKRVLGLSTLEPVRTPEDISKLRFRVPFGKAWENMALSLGAKTIIPIEIRSVRKAFDNNEIDAQDNPLPTVKSKKLYEVIRQIVDTNHIHDWLHFMVSKRVWNALTDEQKNVIEKAFEKVCENFNQKRFDEEATLIQEFKEKGIIITHLTPDERERFRNFAASTFRE